MILECLPAKFQAFGEVEGITKEKVSEEYAKAHHGLWYDELVEKGIIVEEDAKNQ